jgi:hypothetical protein
MDAWIPNYRELTQEKKAILALLVEGRPNLEAQLADLKVTARCICGCPGIALGNSPDENISPDGRSPVAEYRGRAASGTLVGVYLMEREGMIVELEGVGCDGEFEAWPPIEKLKPENSPSELIENSSNSSPPSAAPRKIVRLTAVQKVWVLILLLTITGALLQLVLYLSK